MIAGISDPADARPPARTMVELPARRRYPGVARLVIGGVAARFELPIDRVDDLLLAVDSLLMQEVVGEIAQVEATASEPEWTVAAERSGRAARRRGAPSDRHPPRRHRRRGARGRGRSLDRARDRRRPPGRGVTDDEGRRLRRPDRGVPGGDQTARDRLVERYMPLVRSLAGRYAVRGEPHEDLVQVGAIGLLLAIERFDTCRRCSSRRTRCRRSSARSSDTSATAPGRFTSLVA